MISLHVFELYYIVGVNSPSSSRFCSFPVVEELEILPCTVEVEEIVLYPSLGEDKR